MQRDPRVTRQPGLHRRDTQLAPPAGIVTICTVHPLRNHPGGCWRCGPYGEQLSGMTNEGDKPTFGTLPGERERAAARDAFEAALDDPDELRSLIDPDESEHQDDRRAQPPGDDPPRPPGDPTITTSEALAPAPSAPPPPPRRPAPVRSWRRVRWPSVAATGLIGLLISGVLASLLDTGDAKHPPPSALQAPRTPITPGPVLPAGAEKWMIDAQVALAEVREALAAIEAAEREWLAQPAGRREGALPPPVVELQARKASLRQQEATLVTDLATIAAVHDSARQVRELESQLAELERAVPNSPAAPTATARRAENRERMLREQLQTRREELTRWQSGAYTAITTPLPDPPPVQPVVGAVVELTQQPDDPTPDDTPDPTVGITPGREPQPADDTPDDDEGTGEPPDPEADEADELPTPGDGDGEQLDPQASVGASPVDTLPIPAAVEPDSPDSPDVPAEASASPSTDSVDPEALYEQLERLDAAVEQLDQELDHTLDELRPHLEHGSDLGGDRGQPSEPDEADGVDVSTNDGTTGDEVSTGNGATDVDASCECDDTISGGGTGSGGADAPNLHAQADVPSSDDLAEVSEQFNRSASTVAEKVEVTGELHITGHYDSETRTGDVEATGHLTVTDKTSGATQTITFTDDDGAGAGQMPQYLPGTIQMAMDTTSAVQPEPAADAPSRISAALAGPA